jgi:hypothetical protein
MNDALGTKPRISIVVPVLNEVEGIAQLYEKLTKVHTLLS